MDSGEPQERTDAWAEIVCGDAEVQTITRAELAAESESGDVVARGICERDVITGTLTQKQQILSLYSSDNAMETYLSGIDCDSDPLRVNGDDWVARTYVEELAPDMVEPVPSSPAGPAAAGLGCDSPEGSANARITAR